MEENVDEKRKRLTQKLIYVVSTTNIN